MFIWPNTVSRSDPGLIVVPWACSSTETKQVGSGARVGPRPDPSVWPCISLSLLSVPEVDQWGSQHSVVAEFYFSLPAWVRELSHSAFRYSEWLLSLTILEEFPSLLPLRKRDSWKPPSMYAQSQAFSIPATGFLWCLVHRNIYCFKTGLYLLLSICVNCSGSEF